VGISHFAGNTLKRSRRHAPHETFLLSDSTRSYKAPRFWGFDASPPLLHELLKTNVSLKITGLPGLDAASPVFLFEQAIGGKPMVTGLK
jgi:hypothetical protein